MTLHTIILFYFIYIAYNISTSFWRKLCVRLWKIESEKVFTIYSPAIHGHTEQWTPLDVDIVVYVYRDLHNVLIPRNCLFSFLFIWKKSKKMVDISSCTDSDVRASPFEMYIDTLRYLFFYREVGMRPESGRIYRKNAMTCNIVRRNKNSFWGMFMTMTTQVRIEKNVDLFRFFNVKYTWHRVCM